MYVWRTHRAILMFFLSFVHDFQRNFIRPSDQQNKILQFSCYKILCFIIRSGDTEHGTVTVLFYCIAHTTSPSLLHLSPSITLIPKSSINLNVANAESFYSWRILFGSSPANETCSSIIRSLFHKNKHTHIYFEQLICLSLSLPGLRSFVLMHYLAKARNKDNAFF